LPQAKDEAEQLEALSESESGGSAPYSDDEHESHGSGKKASNESETFEYPTDNEDDEDDVASTTAHHIKTEPAHSERELGEYTDKDLSDVGTAPELQPDRLPTGTSSTILINGMGCTLE
jgi:hypothetical protein